MIINTAKRGFASLDVTTRYNIYLITAFIKRLSLLMPPRKCLSFDRGHQIWLACEQALGLGVWIFVGGGGGWREKNESSPPPPTKIQTSSPRACSQAKIWQDIISFVAD